MFHWCFIFSGRCFWCVVDVFDVSSIIDIDGFWCVCARNKHVLIGMLSCVFEVLRICVEMLLESYQRGYATAETRGFKFEPSCSHTYWATQATMQLLVNDIIAPYFDWKKEELELLSTQCSLWMIDCWSVHKSEEFCTWMKTVHPTIIISFVPGNCTGVLTSAFKESWSRVWSSLHTKTSLMRQWLTLIWAHRQAHSNSTQPSELYTIDP
jgi:hypothetical protein